MAIDSFKVDNKFVRIQALEKREKVLNLHRKGLNSHEIGKELGIHAVQVRAILGVYKRALRKKITRHMEEMRRAMVDRHEDLYKEARQAWERSLKTRVTKTVEAKGKSEADIKAKKAAGNGDVKIRRQVEARDGNPAFLAQASHHLQEQAKLLALYPADKLELTGAGGGPVEMRADDRTLVRKAFERLVEQGMSLGDARAGLLALGMESGDVDSIYEELNLGEPAMALTETFDDEAL